MSNDDMSFVKDKILEKYNEKMVNDILSCEKVVDGIKILKSLKNPSDKFYMKLLSKNGSHLSAIENPSVDLIMAAISNCVHAISCIKNPSIEILEKMKVEDLHDVSEIVLKNRSLPIETKLFVVKTFAENPLCPDLNFLERRSLYLFEEYGKNWKTIYKKMSQKYTNIIAKKELKKKINGFDPKVFKKSSDKKQSTLP